MRWRQINTVVLDDNGFYNLHQHHSADLEDHSMTSSIFYHGRDNLDHMVTFSVADAYYDYYLPTSIQVDACEYIAKRFPAKGLNYAKKRAQRVVRRENAIL